MYRLSRSVYAKEFVVKGAMLLRVWTGEQYRPTKDLDLLRSWINLPKNKSSATFAHSP